MTYEQAFNEGIDIGVPLVRCNECYWVGPEDDLATDIDIDEHGNWITIESCPNCGEDHALMDQFNNQNK